jgi:hypothetical protein
MYVTPKSLAGKYFRTKFYENFTIVEFDGEPTPIPKKSLNYVGYSPVSPEFAPFAQKSNPHFSQISAQQYLFYVNTMKSSIFSDFWVDFAKSLTYNTVASAKIGSEVTKC